MVDCCASMFIFICIKTYIIICMNIHPPTDTNYRYIHTTTTSLSKLRTVGVHSQCHTQPIHLLPQMKF